MDGAAAVEPSKGSELLIAPCFSLVETVAALDLVETVTDLDLLRTVHLAGRQRRHRKSSVHQLLKAFLVAGLESLERN